MRDYDQEYYFLQKTDNPRLPSLTANDDTVNRNYTFQVQPVSSPPLVFFNGAKDYDKKLKLTAVRELPDILFNGNNPLVRTHIRDALLQLDLASLHMHPAVYIDDNEKWHEDYWFLTFAERFDCWDRARSDFEDEPLELGGFMLHSVYSYSLDAAVLEAVPLDERLLFKLGGTQDAFVVCHASIAGLFRRDGRSGAILTPVHEY